MKKVGIISCLITLVFAVSCNTADSQLSGYGKLSPEEYQQLLRKARAFVAVAPKLKLTPISNEDKRFIYTHEPKFHIEYYGYKSGVFKLIWTINPGYAVRIIGKGKFLDDSCKFRMTVSRFVQ